jgi:hypothetical protein
MAKVDEDNAGWRTSASERSGHENFERFQRRRYQVLQTLLHCGSLLIGTSPHLMPRKAADL